MCYLSSYSLQSRRSFGEGVLSIFSAKIMTAIFDFNGSFWSNRKTTVARSHSSWSFFFSCTVLFHHGHVGGNDFSSCWWSWRFVTFIHVKFDFIFISHLLFCCINNLAIIWRNWDGTVVRALVSHRGAWDPFPGPGVTCGLNLLLFLVLASIACRAGVISASECSVFS